MLYMIQTTIYDVKSILKNTHGVEIQMYLLQERNTQLD